MVLFLALDLPSSKTLAALDATVAEVCLLVLDCARALPAIDFATLLEVGLLRTPDALEPTLALVFSDLDMNPPTV